MLHLTSKTLLTTAAAFLFALIGFLFLVLVNHAQVANNSYTDTQCEAVYGAEFHIEGSAKQGYICVNLQHITHSL